MVIGRDRRTYRFLKDTRLGRVVLAETADLGSMADSVTDYIAERVVERDRAKDSDLFLARLRLALLPRGSVVEATAAAAPQPAPQSAPAASAQPAQVGAWTPKPAPGESAGLWMLIAFLFGIAAGAIGLIAYAWIRLG